MERVFKTLLKKDFISKFISKIGRFEGKIVGRDAILIWQYLRFNPEYRKEYQQAKRWSKNVSPNRAPDSFSELGSRWALHPYAVDPREPRLPRRTYFLWEPGVLAIDSGRLLSDQNYQKKFLLKLQRICDRELVKDRRLPMPLTVIVNPAFTKKRLIREMTALLESRCKEIPFESMKGSATKNLLDNLFLYYFVKIQKLGLEPKFEYEISERYYRTLYPNAKRQPTLQPHRIKSRIKTFQDLSTQSPWVFFLMPR